MKLFLSTLCFLGEVSLEPGMNVMVHSATQDRLHKYMLPAYLLCRAACGQIG